jgi:hypothetical protein
MLALLLLDVVVVELVFDVPLTVLVVVMVRPVQ